LKVVEARFALDKEGNPAIIARCLMGVEETSGKFQMGFGVARDRPTQEMFLFAFRDYTQNVIATLNEKQKAIEWLEKALEKNGYKWYHLYHSGVEEINGLYAFMVPFDAEGWNELPPTVRIYFEEMLNLLKT